MGGANSLEKTLMLGKIEGRRRRRWQDEMIGWHLCLKGHESEQTLGDSEGRRAWCAAVHEVAKSQTWLNDSRRKKLCDEFCFKNRLYLRKCLKVFEKAAYLAYLQLSSFQASSEVLFSFEFYPSFDKKRIKKKRKNAEVCILISCLVYGKKSYSCAQFSQRPRTVSEI